MLEWLVPLWGVTKLGEAKIWEIDGTVVTIGREEAGNDVALVDVVTTETVWFWLWNPAEGNKPGVDELTLLSLTITWTEVVIADGVSLVDVVEACFNGNVIDFLVSLLYITETDAPKGRELSIEELVEALL